MPNWRSALPAKKKRAYLLLIQVGGARVEKAKKMVQALAPAAACIRRGGSLRGEAPLNNKGCRNTHGKYTLNITQRRGRLPGFE